jgi:hypothetical protein
MAKEKISTLMLIACSIMLLASVCINYVTFKQKQYEPQIHVQYLPQQVQAAKDTLEKYRADTAVIRRVDEAIRIITGRDRTGR